MKLPLGLKGFSSGALTRLDLQKVPIKMADCVKLPKRSLLQAFLLGCSLSSVPLMTVFAQTNAITLERISYLTPNLDSLSRTFQKQGFRISSSEYDPLGVEQYSIVLPSLQTVELETSHSSDSADWRRKAIRAYGTHVSGVVFSVPDIRILARTFDSVGISHSAIEADRQGASIHVGMTGPQPLDVVFESPPSSPKPPAVDTVEQPRLSRISWLLLTASPSEEALFRRIFSALSLRKKHEGCCDYWLIGQPENRIAVRFELPTTTFFGKGDWLSIEPGGVVFFY